MLKHMDIKLNVSRVDLWEFPSILCFRNTAGWMEMFIVTKFHAVYFAFFFFSFCYFFWRVSLHWCISRDALRHASKYIYLPCIGSHPQYEDTKNPTQPENPNIYKEHYYRCRARMSHQSNEVITYRKYTEYSSKYSCRHTLQKADSLELLEWYSQSARY